MHSVVGRRAGSRKRVQKKAFAEFFAGIGLVGEALRKTGWACEYANDIDPKKREIYEANFSDVDKYHEHDIWNTDAILSRLKIAPVLATSTFPCTDLSLAGNWKGFDGVHSSTFFGFMEVLKRLGKKSPKLILLENVPGFLAARNGDDFRSATTALAELGYWIDSFAIDARAFVPQSRQRIFLLCVRDDVRSELLVRDSHPFWKAAAFSPGTARTAPIQKFMQTHSLKTGWVATPIKRPPQRKYDLTRIIDTGDDQAWWGPADVKKHYKGMSDLHRDRIDAIIGSGERLVATGYRRKRAGTTRLEVRFDGIAGCLRTPRGGSARQIVVLVESGELKIRWMSAVEYARLQGVGRFKLLDNERQMLFGFGDAVCVPVIEWIDKCVLTPLYEDCLR